MLGKNLLIGGSIVLVLIGGAIGYSISKLTKIVPEEKQEELQVEEKAPCDELKYVTSNKQDNGEEDLKKAYETVISFIKVMKSSKSDNYSEKLSSVKNLISDDLYQELLPEDNKEQEKSDSVININTNITNVKVAISQNKDEMFVIYTSEVSVNNSSTTTTRFFYRVKIKKINNVYKITKILEDSQLYDGLYEGMR